MQRIGTFIYLEKAHGDVEKKMNFLMRWAGINLEEFDRKSPKKRSDLLDEIENLDAKLGLDIRSRRLIRFAYTAAVLIRVPSQRVQFLEIARERKRFGKREPVMGVKKWTITETKKTNELPTEAAVRGLREELQLIVNPSQLQSLAQLPPLAYIPLDFPPPYRSSAYDGMWSRVVIEQFVLDLLYLPWLETTRVVHDGKTRIHIQRFPIKS